MQGGRFGAVTRYAEATANARPCSRGLVLRLLRAAAGVLHFGRALHWFQLLGASNLAGRSLGVLHIGRASGFRHVGGAFVVSHTGRATAWCRVSGELRFGAAYGESQGLLRNIGRTSRVLGTKVGAVPAERRGLGVLRIASARSRLMLAMGCAAHCARCLGTLRFECSGGAGVWRGSGLVVERSEGGAGILTVVHSACAGASQKHGGPIVPIAPQY